MRRKADPIDRFPAFVAEVRARLEAGREAYGDRSFERPPAELLAELEQEALDLAGWGMILWTRVRALRERAAAGAAVAPQVPAHVASVLDDLAELCGRTPAEVLELALGSYLGALRAAVQAEDEP